MDVAVLLWLDNLDSCRFATCQGIVHVSEIAQVLALGPHQFVGTESVPGSFLGFVPVLRGGRLSGFYTVSNLSITVSVSCRIVHICTATVIKAPIRPTIGNYHFPRFCHSVRGRVLFPWSPTCCHRPPEVFQRCMTCQYRRSRKVRGCEHGAPYISIISEF